MTDTSHDGPEIVRLSGGQGYGCQGWTSGDVIRNSDIRVERGEPRYLVVLTASRRYIRDEGMSFGVGDEQGFVYSATCRPATDEESAPLRERERRVEESVLAQAQLGEIAIGFRRDGECPRAEQQIVLHGEEIERGRRGDRMYGGGEWFVLQPDEGWIWWILNNGMDGDNWSHSNVRTGGAGAIGWRLPYTVELAETVRRLTALTREDS